MIHSGSRNLDAQVGSYYNEKAKALNKRWFSNVDPNIDMAFLPMQSDETHAYWDEMNYCIEFALCNRKLMMERICQTGSEGGSKESEKVKRQIWKSMMPDITDANAAYLADKFELSGGQIENVTRKKTIQSILSGNEPAIEDLIKYCCEEEIGANKERRRIGF